MSNEVDAAIQAFLSGSPFAVAGASQSRHKYGNKVLRCYWQRGYVAYPVNPSHTVVEGAKSFASLADLPQRPHGVSLITQPEVSERIVDEALQLGVRHFWFQPGAEHRAAIDRARAAGCVVIADGPCLLVVLRYDASI